jgi:leucyl/phenylalanyl-tRNA--protein transferase
LNAVATVDHKITAPTAYKAAFPFPLFFISVIDNLLNFRYYHYKKCFLFDKAQMTIKETLEPFNMLNLYANGAFPMADENGDLNWYYPKVRTIIPLDDYNIPRSLKKFMTTADFEYRYDFETMTIVKECAKRSETWISSELINAYEGLDMIGALHSVSVYQNEKLVGGLYGVAVKGAFFGESMFSKVSQASKCALVKLIERLNERKFSLLDVQFITDHLQMFGAREIDLEEFNRLLDKAYSEEILF